MLLSIFYTVELVAINSIAAMIVMKFKISRQHALEGVIPVVEVMLKRCQDMQSYEGQNKLTTPIVNDMPVDAEIGKKGNLEPKPTCGPHTQRAPHVFCIGKPAGKWNQQHCCVK